MKINFIQNQELTDNEIIVNVESKEYSEEVKNIMASIDNKDRGQDILAINGPDKIFTISVEQIIAIEIWKNELTFLNVDGKYSAKGKLFEVIERLNSDDFVQVSKSSVINLNHLQYLEASFSGNMLAVLNNDVKETVSRRYLANLKMRLGVK
ncbi:LytTR family DNA-binding domain-containing protein [Lactobacillus sp. YT155]|uniref:LytTR family DNA-binding domain-containing protein n=1 Tax=Lactobacillus sp. YT155 TaxID=3060955 RepID=UPI00265FD401|nr:LytTR family DNA-binding domain-containing protein [Lactobacillus sp. YT155]MDO1605940.1 LytTR family DNA-binding domain-containing protein [Lactobacillus sp. YT155]